jgi:hypothetical protein
VNTYARAARAETRGPRIRIEQLGSYRTAWERAVKRAKLPDLHWHDLRHTFASWAVQRRVSLYELKELLGHSTLTMVRRYAHLAPEHLRAAAAALDGVLAPASAIIPSAVNLSEGEVRSKETASQCRCLGYPPSAHAPPCELSRRRCGRVSVVSRVGLEPTTP